jgi:hypothetical protein
MMRVPQRMVLAAMLLAVVGCSGIPADVAARDRDTEPCRITVQALLGVIPSGPWRWSRESTRIHPRLTEQEILQEFPGETLTDDDWRWFAINPETSLPVRAEAPSRAMARAFATAEPVDGIACQSVLDLASESGALVKGGRAIAGKDGFYPVTYLSVHRAVLSPDGTEALVYVGSTHGPLAGGGYLVLFRKQADGSWRENARLGVWVS